MALIVLGWSFAEAPALEAAEMTGRVMVSDAASVSASNSPAAPGRCLTRQEQRAHIAAKTVIPLARAAQAVKGRRDELLSARLCEREGKLVYLLTVLARNGKVVRVTVDAGSGALVNAAH